MCDYCDNKDIMLTGNTPLIEENIDLGDLGTSSVGLEIAHWINSEGAAHDPVLVLNVDRPDSNRELLLAFRSIHYCPICGRRLD